MKDGTGPLDDEVLREAAEWLVRASEGLSAEDVRSLRIWRMRDLRNDAAFRALEDLWDDIPRLDLAEETAPPAFAEEEDGPPPRRWGWKAGVGVLAGLAAAATAAFVVLPGVGQDPAQHFSTSAAQINDVELADGSLVTLGPKSEISVAFSDAERRLRLDRGEAFFKVEKGRPRPFVVQAGLTNVRAVGTQFNVKRSGTALDVAVLEGAVEILPAQGGKPLALLQRGDWAKLTLGQGGQVRLLGVTRYDNLGALDSLAAGWREGWLSYEEATLGEIVDDLNRYYDPQIRLEDGRLARLKVTASFKAEKIQNFVRSLGTLFPVEVTKLPDNSYRLRSTGGAAR